MKIQDYPFFNYKIIIIKLASSINEININKVFVHIIQTIQNIFKSISPYL